MAFNLSLAKKNNAAATMASPWHANFRNYQQLPDTKVVRTTFFINTAAIAVVLGLMLWLGFREYHIYNLRIQIAGSQKEIDTHARANREALRLNKAFEVEAKKIAEAQAFRQALMNPAEFVTLLGQTLPKSITIESVEARLAEPNGGVTFMVRGQVAGEAGEAAGVAAGYVDMLRAHPRLGAVFSAINLANLSRDARSNSLTFDISLRVKADGKEKK
jgi:hypothetical protein